MNGLTKFTLSGILALMIFTPAAFAQGMFDDAPQVANDAEVAKEMVAENKDPASTMTKQQLARAVVEATSPILTMADVKSGADLERAQAINAAQKTKKQATVEATFTRSELQALYRFYASPDGGSVGAKLGAIEKNRILGELNK